jgi:hypothetical protein
MKMSAKPPKATANSKLLLSKQRIADWAEEVRFKDRVDFVFFTGRGPYSFHWAPTYGWVNEECFWRYASKELAGTDQESLIAAFLLGHK